MVYKGRLAWYDAYTFKVQILSFSKMLFNIVTLLALAPSVLSAVTDNGAKRRNVVPGGYIVEFEDVMSVASDVCLKSESEGLPLTCL
jgi:hypothetical protein